MKQLYAIITIILCTTGFLFSSSTASAQDKTYSIGERGPAGGWIFYDKGSKTDGWQYLEAAPEDIGDETGWYRSGYIDIGRTLTAIGTGKINTDKIIKAHGEGKYAAKLCTEYRGGDKSDWFLPSKDELNLMIKNLLDKGIGNFKGSNYWSSTENMEYVAWIKSFYMGNKASSLSDDLTRKRVRAIRAF